MDKFGRIFDRIKSMFAKKKEGDAHLSVTMAGDDGGTKKMKNVSQEGNGKKKDSLNRILSRYKGAFMAREKPPGMILSVAATSFKIAVVFLLLLGFIAGGALIGVANSYVNTAPELELTKLTDAKLASKIFDRNGELITVYMGTENRDWARIEEIPLLLQYAFVAVEDSRFFEHPGVDIKRLVGAFVGNLTSDRTEGASTITQQLIKNRMLTPERSYKRKIQEAYLALMLEQVYGKDLILETYLNDISLGQLNYGVKAAAQDYFGKTLDQLTIRECAMLAGVANNPTKFDPRRNKYIRNTPQVTDDRANLVLRRMRDNGYITNEEYEVALVEVVAIREHNSSTALYAMPYFVEYAIKNIIDNMLRVRGLDDTAQNRNIIDQELRTKGYHITLTTDLATQTAVENIVYTHRYPAVGKGVSGQTEDPNPDGSVTVVKQPQVGTTVVDYRTGELIAMVGGREAPTARLQQNRSYQTRLSVGSSIKPLAVYGPAIDTYGYGDATMIDNSDRPLKEWNRTIGGGGTRGPVTMRSAIVGSYNRAAARMLTEMMGDDYHGLSIDYLSKLGINTSERYVPRTAASLATGVAGFSVLEETVAFGTIANKGEYLSPIAFLKITDANGTLVLDAHAIQERRQVFKNSTSWLLVSMLTDAVSGGTGTAARVSGQTTAGKTGTNDSHKGITFAGFTGYYACAVYIGHDEYKPLANTYGGTSTVGAAPLFRKIMQKLHEGKPNKAIIAETPAQMGLVRRTVCADSGMKPTDTCAVTTGWFPADSLLANQACDTSTHQIRVKICTESKLLATDYCLETELVLEADAPQEYCTLHQGISPSPSPSSEPTPPVITTPTPDPIRAAAVTAAQSYIGQVQTRMANLGSQLSAVQRSELNGLITAVQGIINNAQSTAAQINQAVASLQGRANAIFGNLSTPTPPPGTPTPPPGIPTPTPNGG